MPHIRVRGTSAEVVRRLSENAHQVLATKLHTSPDNFTFELVQTQFFTAGKPDPGYPFVEVYWFERGPEARSQVVSYLTEEIRRFHAAGDVAVVFRALPAGDYFENGKSF